MYFISWASGVSHKRHKCGVAQPGTERTHSSHTWWLCLFPSIPTVGYWKVFLSPQLSPQERARWCSWRTKSLPGIWGMLTPELQFVLLSFWRLFKTNINPAFFQLIWIENLKWAVSQLVFSLWHFFFYFQTNWTYMILHSLSDMVS